VEERKHCAHASGKIRAAFAKRRAAPGGAARHDGRMAAPPPPSAQAHRAQLRARWEALLRARPACSPLAHPDTLVHLLDTTLDALFAALRRPATGPRRPARLPAATPCAGSCRCGLNPLLAYFAAGELALRETAGPPALCHALRRIAREELGTFCSLCQHPHAARWARAQAAAGPRQPSQPARAGKTAAALSGPPEQTPA
jgi:hypothetical protein